MSKSMLGKNRGSKHGKWKGDDVSYRSLHKWLVRNFGRASVCEFCNIQKAKRYEWALIKGKRYTHKRENFIALCKSCHFHYDFTEEYRNNMIKAQKKRRNKLIS